MASPSGSRGRSATRSPTPVSARSRHRSDSLQRSISPRSDSLSRTPSRSRSPSTRRGGDRHDGYRGRRTLTRSESGSRSPLRSTSRDGRGRGRGRDRSYTRSISREGPAKKSTKIVVEKLTKNVTEAHIREIFDTYGAIQSLDMPMNKQFWTNRGTAYIIYSSVTSAESAISHMHEAQLDGAVINVSIVLPRRKFSRSPPPARMGGRGAPPFDRFGGGGPGSSFRNAPPRQAPSGRFRSPPGRRYGSGRDRGRDRDMDTYRPRSISRSPSPRRRTRSPSYSSRSRSPPRRRGGTRDSPRRRRRSPSYSSYSSYSDRSQSRSRARHGGRR